MVCSTCGIEDRLYRHGLCVRCSLAEQAARLLGGPRPELAPVYEAIVAARQPYSAHNWLRSTSAARILAAIASGEMALSHEALDAQASHRAAAFLRQLLVANDVLPPRDEAIVALEAWVAVRLGEVDDPSERRLLRSYATWGVLRQARSRAQRTPRARTATAYAKSCLLAAIAFFVFLRERQVSLAECRQAEIDAWCAERGSSAHLLVDFLTWAKGRKLVGGLNLPTRPRGEGATMGRDARLEIVGRLLHDEQLLLADRVAGCLVLLYAQQLSRIVAITADRVVTEDGIVYLKLGPTKAIVPEPLGGLLIALAATECHAGGGASPEWDGGFSTEPTTRRRPRTPCCTLEWT